MVSDKLAFAAFVLGHDVLYRELMILQFLDRKKYEVCLDQN